MENVLLIVELILALFIIIVVLLQRSEGGALGMGGGGGGLVTARGAGNALTKVTWALAAGFFAVALALTVLAAQRSGSASVIDGTAADGAAPIEAPAEQGLPALNLDGLTDKPGASPLFPPAAE